MILGWLLRQLDLSRASDLGFDEAELGEFRESLVAKLAEAGD